MHDEELLRYSRHILLESIGVQGQMRIRASHALIVGLGGLGSPVALYLAAAGVGNITLLDHDKVEMPDLQRQVVHDTHAAQRQMPKVHSAHQSMRRINPQVHIEPICERATAALLDTLALTADVVIDCTDNFGTRHLVNAACVKHRKPLVSGACVKLDAQLTVFAPHADPDSPCYACVFPQSETVEEVACATLGVLGPLVGSIGALQAAEALKLLAQPTYKSALLSRLLLLDGAAMRWDEIQTKRMTQCPVCAPVP